MFSHIFLWFLRRFPIMTPCTKVQKPTISSREAREAGTGSLEGLSTWGPWFLAWYSKFYWKYCPFIVSFQSFPIEHVDFPRYPPLCHQTFSVLEAMDHRNQWFSERSRPPFSEGIFQQTMFDYRRVHLIAISGVGKCPNVSHHPHIGEISSPTITWKWCSNSQKLDVYQTLYIPSGNVTKLLILWPSRNT